MFLGNLFIFSCLLLVVIGILGNCTLGGVQRIVGVEGHAGVDWGQPEIKLLRNALWPTTFGKNNF